MQRVFDHHVFELEKDVYTEEGVDSSQHAFRDNSPIINLLSAKPSGLLRLLDEQCMMGEALATDAAFLQRCDNAHRNSQDVSTGLVILKVGETLGFYFCSRSHLFVTLAPRRRSAFYKARPNLSRDGEFLIAHFAGPVTYQVEVGSSFQFIGWTAQSRRKKECNNTHMHLKGFILKNTDAIQADLVALLTSPKLVIV